MSPTAQVIVQGFLRARPAPRKKCHVEPRFSDICRVPRFQVGLPGAETSIIEGDSPPVWWCGVVLSRSYVHLS